HADKIALASSHNLSASEPELMRRVENGDARAAAELARYYLFIEQDEETALRWYQKSATLGGRAEREVYESFKSARAEFENEHSR
ncbi:MAG: SEL1-like repeat protein, partial [Prosthecobacter sp.]|nr:SEL1-like repeat protein [Prosthecobacter sp.]